MEEIPGGVIKDFSKTAVQQILVKTTYEVPKKQRMQNVPYINLFINVTWLYGLVPPSHTVIHHRLNPQRLTAILQYYFVQASILT